MNLARLIAVVLAVLACATPVRSAPLEAYGRLPTIEDVALSPDGTMVALAVTDGENRLVTITRIGESRPFAALDAGDKKLRSILWAGNDHLLVTLSVTTRAEGVIAPRNEWFQTRTYNVRTRAQNALLRRIDGAMNVTLSGPYVRMVDGQPRVFLVGYALPESAGRFTYSLFDVDPAATTATIADTGLNDTRDWAIDEQGRSVGTLLIASDGSWRIEVRTPGGRWRRATAGAPTYNRPPGLLSLGRDGRSVVVRGQEGDRGTFREIDLSTGAWSEPIGEGEATTALFHPVTQRFAGLLRLDGDNWRWTYFSQVDQRNFNAILAAFPGEVVTPVSYSQDLRRVVVRADSPTLGPGYSLVDFNTGRATWLGQEYAGLRESDISPVRYITYRAADGMEISGYLTLPQGRAERNLPLVVLPHGGPEDRDVRLFDWRAQALASRGYAVFQPNFRGSAGYGAAFIRAGHGQWGRKMQTDLSDGVAHLAAQGVIDPGRVCIVGVDYGGYAALAGVTLQSNVYRCAVSFGGLSDPAAFIRYVTNRSGPRLAPQLLEWMGATSLGDPQLAAISPLAHASAAGAPILLIHGRDDVVVPFSQSSQMAAALRRAQHPVELVALDGEDHWLSRGDTRLRMLTETVRFLETHNPPDPAPPLPATATSSAP